MLILKFARELLILLYFALLIGGIMRRKELSSKIWFFLCSIFITLVVELSVYLGLLKYVSQLGLIYGLFILGFAVSLFIIYFRNLALTQQWKYLQTILLAVNIGTVVIGLLTNEEYRYYLRGWPLYTSFFILIISLALFLFEMYNSDLILSLKSYFPYYAAFGLLFIYVGILPVMYFRFYLQNEEERKIFEILLYSVNFLGYSAILVGVFLAKRLQLPKMSDGSNGS